MSKCIFCEIPSEYSLPKNKLSYTRYDKYPVTKGHLLIVPFRHVSNYFDTSAEEKEALWDLVETAKEFLDNKFTPGGYNVGINIGKEAGQTVMHLHIHLIPRYKGDMDDPSGGVRGVLPEKQKY